MIRQMFGLFGYQDLLGLTTASDWHVVGHCENGKKILVYFFIKAKGSFFFLLNIAGSFFVSHL